MVSDAASSFIAVEENTKRPGRQGRAVLVK
jgi:hypothetical protein